MVIRAFVDKIYRVDGELRCMHEIMTACRSPVLRQTHPFEWSLPQHIVFGVGISLKDVCEVPVMRGELLVGLPIGQLAIVADAILPKRGAIWIFATHSSSPGADGSSSAWISHIRSPIEVGSLNMLAGIERGGGSTQRGMQVRNSLRRPPHHLQFPSTKSCSRTISFTVKKPARGF
jgi:hypothetical protein